MKSVVKKTLVIETKRFDFDNEFAYLEIWHNAKLKDCYFAEKQFLFPDGSLKRGGKKYFFCNNPDDLEKKVYPLNYQTFKWFDNLYYIDDSGEIISILQS